MFIPQIVPYTRIKRYARCTYYSLPATVPCIPVNDPLDNSVPISFVDIPLLCCKGKNRILLLPLTLPASFASFVVA